MVLIPLCWSSVYLILTVAMWLWLTVSLFHPIAIGKLSEVEELLPYRKDAKLLE